MISISCFKFLILVIRALPIKEYEIPPYHSLLPPPSKGIQVIIQVKQNEVLKDTKVSSN